MRNKKSLLLVFWSGSSQFHFSTPWCCEKSYLTFHGSPTPRNSAANFCRDSFSENNRRRMSFAERSVLLRGKSSHFSCAARQLRLNLVFAGTMIKRGGGYWIFTRVRPATSRSIISPVDVAITRLTARPELDASIVFRMRFISLLALSLFLILALVSTTCYVRTTLL